MEEINVNPQEQQDWVVLDFDDLNPKESEELLSDNALNNDEPQNDNDNKDDEVVDNTQDDNSNDTVVDDNKSKKEDESGEATLKDYLDILKEEAGLDDNDLEGIETIEDLWKINQQLINNKVEEQLNKLTEKIGDVGVEFLRFVANGGNPKDFIRNLENIDDTNITFIEGDENNHENIIRMYMKEKGYDEDDIKDTIEGFKNAGKLEDKAKLYYEKLQKVLEDKKRKLTEQQKKQQEELKRKREEFEKVLSNKIKETNDINGYRLSQKEKEELKNYILKPVVQTNDGNFISQLQKDLNEYLSKPENLIVLGLITKNGFNLDFLKKKVESDVAKKTKKIISTGGIKQQQTNKSILDFLEKL